MTIPMPHTPSAVGLVSSLGGESSATAQTEMHTSEAPKHVPHVNIKICKLLYAAFSARRAWEESIYLYNPRHLGLID